jgi:Icc-related predicted phosphoesterase
MTKPFRPVKIVAVSDLHGHLPEIPACDFCLLGGDLCPASDHSVGRQASWLDSKFRSWLGGIPSRHTIGVAGNHDFVFEESPQRVPLGMRWTYLQDQAAEIEGIRFWGAPHQPTFHNWAFNLEPDQLRKKWSLIPSDTQVLVLHGPPSGYGDFAPRHLNPGDDDTKWPSGEHVGCPHLTQRMGQLESLELAVYGHIHSGHGLYRPGGDGGPLLANVSLVDERYKPVYGVTVLELNIPSWTGP